MFRNFRITTKVINNLLKESLISSNNCQVNSVRLKKVLIRKPIKVLSSDGKDYYEQHVTTKQVSRREHELNRKELAKYQKVDKYYEDGVVDDDFEKQGYEWEKTDHHQDKLRFKEFEIRQKAEKEEVLKEQKKEKERAKKEKKLSQEKENQKPVPKPRLPGIPTYIKLGEDNSEFVNTIQLLKRKKMRNKRDLMLLEGKRLICDALDAGITLKTVYFSIEENLLGIPNLMELAADGVEFKKVFYKDLKLFSEMTTSPGVMGIFEKPTTQEIVNNPLFEKEKKLPIILVGDNIRDPGNLGTIIRCAAAVGIEKVILTKGCVDPWERKVLRAGAGAHFRLQIVDGVEWSLIFNHLPVNRPFNLFVADNNTDESINKPAIKSSPFLQKKLNEETNEMIFQDDSYQDESLLVNYSNIEIPSTSYNEANFFSESIDKPNILVIGGETHGLSHQANKLCCDYFGQKLKIPLALGMDSLNSAIAAAIILYEMRRHLVVRNPECLQNQQQQ